MASRIARKIRRGCLTEESIHFSCILLDWAGAADFSQYVCGSARVSSISVICLLCFIGDSKGDYNFMRNHSVENDNRNRMLKADEEDGRRVVEVSKG